jgi:protein O-GlcNAc transferase
MADGSPLKRLARLINARLARPRPPAEQQVSPNGTEKSIAPGAALSDSPLIRGNAALARGELAVAEACYRQAVDEQDSAEANVNLGFAISLQGRNAEALTPLRRAFVLSPTNSDACYLLGSTLLACGAPVDARPYLSRAIEIDSGLSVAYRDLARALHESGEHDAAIRLLFQRISSEPSFVDLHLAAGNILAFVNRLSEAVASYEAALALQPQNAAVLSSMAPALCALGETDRAIACAQAAIAVDPQSVVARSNLLLALSSAPAGSVANYLAEAATFDRLVEANAASLRNEPPRQAGERRSDGRRLRVGFLSGDFRSHPVAYFLSPLLAHWDGGEMEAIAYSNHPAHDEQTATLRSRFAKWRDVWALSDLTLAQTIEGDEVDVLIDLSGHTPGNRLSMFPLRPARIQASWLGYWASTGLRSIDFVLVDETSVPPAHRDQFVEDVVYLPVTRLCFDCPGTDPADPAPLPAATNGYLTFGSFQRLTKINDAVIHLWARILTLLPTARLRLQAAQLSDETAARALLARFAASGVAHARIDLHGPRSRRDYLQAHSAVDIILDTFPHAGATTTCEALWMGVPTITLPGSSLLSRQGASLLNAAGLQEWIAQDDDDFVSRAVGWADRVPALGALRSTLRESTRASPLMDGKRFACSFQTVLTRYAHTSQAQRDVSLTRPSCPRARPTELTP